MSQILDFGYWSDYSCEQRPWLMAGLVLLFGAVFTILMTLKIVLSKPNPHAGKTILWVAAFSMIVLPLFATIPALARTTTMIAVESNNLVLTGCWRGMPYEERNPLSAVKSKYSETSGKSKRPELHLQWPHQKGSVRIDLENNQYLANLAAIAPKAMTDYVRALQAKGQSIPAPLRALTDSASKP